MEAWGKLVTEGGVVRLLGLKDFPVAERELNLDFSSLIGLLFFDWMFQFLLPMTLVGVSVGSLLKEGYFFLQLLVTACCH